jgi:hypothetical protein
MGDSLETLCILPAYALKRSPYGHLLKIICRIDAFLCTLVVPRSKK